MAMSLRKMDFSQKLEWIYLVYLAFFVLAVLSPSVVTKDYFGFSQTSIEEFMIFILGFGALGTFSIYERLMERRMREREEALGDAERAKAELLSAYRYIGSVNRQIELLKKLANETSLSLVDADAYWKDLLQSLAANAAATINASRVLIRFIELDRLRTEREIFYGGNESTIRMSNKELKKLHDYGASHAFMQTEDGEEILVVPSDRKDHPLKAYVLLSVADKDQLNESEISLVKVFVNQAELVYHSLSHRREGKSDGAPLDRIKEVTKMVVGEVS